MSYNTFATLSANIFADLTNLIHLFDSIMVMKNIYRSISFSDLSSNLLATTPSASLTLTTALQYLWADIINLQYNILIYQQSGWQRHDLYSNKHIYCAVKSSDPVQATRLYNSKITPW